MNENRPADNFELSEQELKQHVMRSRLRPIAGARDAKIYRALRSIIESGSVFYVLEDVPEQCEDLFSILVDDRNVVGFELDRTDPSASPVNVERESIEDYRKATGAFGRAKLRVALELARKELGK